MQLRVTIEDIIKTLESNPPAIIGISISFGQKNLSDVLIQQISSNTKLMKSMLVVGNVIPSLYCKEYLSHNPNLIISYKEGEESFLDLIDCYLNKIELENVRGIAYISKNGDFKKNNIDLLDLKNLPFPALDTLEGIFYYKGALTLELSRGCNYSKCTFCPRQHKGIQWRCLSVDRMVLYFSILADICKKLHQAPFFYIADEEFIGQLPHDTELKRIYEFCNRIKKIGLDVRFDISARVDSIYREDFTERQNIERLQMWSMLKEIGLQRLFLGVESGCDNQLRRFNKGTTANQNATAIRLITALGINIRIGYITFDPLMENFEDIITGHEFIERTDILYKSVDLNIVSFNEIFDVIVNNNSSPYICLQNKPLYYKVSYPLTSLEVLFSTKYALHIKAYQEVHNITLLEDIDMNMARYRSMYVNKLIGEVSTACQRWIDYNFPVLYSLKGLYKSSTGQVRERIYQLMCYAKSIDHYLLNYILYQLSITDCNINLEKFVSKHDFHLTKFEEIKSDVLKKSLDFWQNIELYFINEVENLLNKGVITDTDDFALTNAIKNWRNNRGNWSMIN